MADPDPELRTGVNCLWEEGLLFDYTIEVDGHEFRAHKAVLAAISGYFKVLLTNGMLESKEDRVKLPGFNSLAMHNMIEFIYQKKFGETKASFDELFTLSTYLQIPSAVKVCTDELCKGLDPENCMTMFYLFTTHHIIEGTEQVIKYIKSNIDAVLVVHRVEDLPLLLISELHDCFGKSEWDLFCCLKEWVNADFDNHKQHADALMSKVRFPLMTPAQLRELKKQDIYKQCPGVWHNLIEMAIKYHRLPTHMKVLDKSEHTRVRANSSPVCFSVSEIEPSFHVLHSEKKWEEHEGFLAPTFSVGVVAVVVNNFLIAYDQNSLDKGMYIFDPRTLTWSTMADLRGTESCVDFALVHHDEHLYAMGGRSGNSVVSQIMRYNFNRNEWNVITTRMPQAIYKHAACVVKDTIYVSGGKHALGGPDTRRVHCLDLNTSTWTAKSPLQQAISGHQMAPLAMMKKMAIAIVKQNLTIQLYGIATDQWTAMELVYNVNQKIPLKTNGNSTIINAGNCLWMLDVTREVDPTQVNWVVNPAGGVDPNQRSEHGVCYKWQCTGLRAELVNVPGKFPLYVQGADENRAIAKKYFTAALSVPLHSSRARP